MHAALNVAGQGFKAIIVERKDRLGGLLNGLASVSHHHKPVPAEDLVDATRERVEADPNITVYTGAVLESVDGYIGNYRVTINVNGNHTTFEASTVIVATGMEEIKPVDQFLYGGDPRVVTQFELEEILKRRRKAEGGRGKAECGMRKLGA